MAKEFPIGTIRHWADGDVIKAHNPVNPYSSGWIPLKTSPELEQIGRSCDSLASEIKNHKLPINGEKFLDHEIDEFVDEEGNKLFDSGDFKQYNGFYGAGYYAFRNEFSKLFMSNAMDLDNFIANALADANERNGGDKNNDTLSVEERRSIRIKAKLDFKESDSLFTVEKAKQLNLIIERTLTQIKEGLDFKDPIKREIYNAFKISADSLPLEYSRIKEKRSLRDAEISIINETFSDNWGVRESCKDYINKKFDEYVKKYTDRISEDSLQDQIEKFGVTIDMPTDEFYKNIYDKLDFSKLDEYEDFKELIYLRFIKKFNKSVEGDWKVTHLPALQNLENAIHDLPDGHFLNNDYLTLITNKSYKGGSHGGYAWYDANDSRINFSADCIDRGTVFGILSNPNEFKSTLFHEIGHAVSKKLGRTGFYNYKKFVVDCGWTYESKELRAGQTATGDQNSIPRTGSNSNVRLISDYSSKSPEEAFAEYYSFYCVNKDRIDKYLQFGDRNFLKDSSKVVCDTETSEREIGRLGIYGRILSDDSSEMHSFNGVKEKLSTFGGVSKIELVSPWNTSLHKSEKKRFDLQKLKQRKNLSVASMPPIVSYLDNGKNIVIDGGTRVEVSRMNKKMVPSITITKELYHKLQDKGLSNRDISNCLYTSNRHEKVLREASPMVTIHGLIHRDRLISVNQIVENTNALRTMQKMYNSKELEKAIKDLFGIPVEDNLIEKSFNDISELYLKGVIDDETFQRAEELYFEKGFGTGIGGAAQIGEVRKRKDGTKWKKVAATGQMSDWKQIKEDGSEIEQKEDEDKQKKGEAPQKKLSPKEIVEAAKSTSEEALNSTIKQSDDPKLREAAHKELDRRTKEEHVQEEP